jgi:hypothetical protein
MIVSLRRNKYYRPILWGGFILCMAVFIWRGMSVVMDIGWLSADDYLGYWAAGEVSANGGNPYDPKQLITLQKEVGWPEDEAVIMWSPPWTLPLVMMLSMFSYPLSRTIWLVVCVILVFISANTLWQLYHGSERFRWSSWLLAFTFIPVLDAFKKGQTGILNLLGVVGFLYFLNIKKPWLAGISLALLVVKPHISYLFLLGVLLWVIHQRVWQVLAGFTLTLIVLTLLAWLANPNVIEQYLLAVKSYPPSDWVTPTVGGMLRLLFGNEKFWVQFLSPLIGVIWLAVYWIRQRNNWIWLEKAPLLVLVSIVTAAYGWSFDQPVVLVAIIQIFALVFNQKWDLSSGLIITAYILINLLDLASPPNEIWLWWLGPTLLIWYLISRWLIDHRTEQITIAQQTNN